MWIIGLLIGLLIGCFIAYLYLQPKLKAVQTYDEVTAAANHDLYIELASLTARKEEITRSLIDLEEQAKIAREQLVKQNKALAEEQFEKSAELLANKFQQETKVYQNEYLNIMAEISSDITTKIAEYKAELVVLESQIANKRAIVNAAVEASKRAAEMVDKQNFYRLNLSPTDIEEIRKLREVIPYLRDSEPLNKVIWKVYYEKPYTDLIGRVVGSGLHTGIYKITNIENNMCYVGQAANIADRFKQHIKRGVGAETATRNKLYPAMLSIGVENFTFEIIEECDRTLLNEREDYWQEYFKAKEFGYSIK